MLTCNFIRGKSSSGLLVMPATGTVRLKMPRPHTQHFPSRRGNLHGRPKKRTSTPDWGSAGGSAKGSHCTFPWSTLYCLVRLCLPEFILVSLSSVSHGISYWIDYLIVQKLNA